MNISPNQTPFVALRVSKSVSMAVFSHYQSVYNSWVNLNVEQVLFQFLNYSGRFYDVLNP